MVLIGKKRHYVEIQAATRTSDSQGGWTITWANAGWEWMRAVPLSQSRTLDNGGISYRMVVEFTANKYSPLYVLTTANRLVWNSENYTIHSIVPSEKLDEIIITAYA
jgi:hypothetical protein